MAMMTTIEKILAKAEALEAQASALRLAVTILNGDVHATKRSTAAKALDQAIALRRAQRNGAKAEAAPERVSKFAATKARRATKRNEILAIVREYGKPMPIAELAEAARKQGIASLTGIAGMTRGGFLKKAGEKGKTRYSLGPAARHD